MSRFRNSLFYIGTIGGFSLLTYWIIQQGTGLEAGRIINVPNTAATQWEQFTDSIHHNIKHPLALLLAQIILIILVARIFGWVCKKIGQPSVIGEILAGIFLGPSLLGSYFPEFSQSLFPAQSLGNLQFLSQLGLILFMFVVGMELDLKSLKNKANDAVVVSHASIIIPFTLGMTLAYFIYGSFAPEGVPFLAFGLFLGIAMSITAFPVLARIVQERGIHKTRLGTMVITCAAADDITAWCLLAAVIAIVKAGSFVSAIYVIALAVAYVVIMLSVVRPFLKRVGELHGSKETLSKPIVALFILTLIISSYATEIIGIHALFGAFMAGAVMPDSAKFRNMFIEKVEDVALVLLLPLFFVFTGLRTEIGLLNDPELWKITGWIILVAVVGKFLGSALAARFVGQNWKDSLTIGALMNTRGLMELVVLNIGYDLGVLNPEVFAMMVIMALVTTIMTGPALDLINHLFKTEEIPDAGSPVTKYKILLAFGNPERGKPLLRLANSLVKTMSDNALVTALHLSPSGELHHFNAEEYEKERFAPLVKESEKLNQKITTLFKASGDIDSDIAELANKGAYDLLLIGVGQSIYEGSLLGKILGFTSRIINPEKLIHQVTGKVNLFENSPFDDGTNLILNKSQVTVGIFIGKGVKEISRVFLPFFEDGDTFLIDYAQKFVDNAGAQVNILDIQDGMIPSAQRMERIRETITKNPANFDLLSEKSVNRLFLEQTDLLVLSAEGWKRLVETKSDWLNHLPNTLILAKRG